MFRSPRIFVPGRALSRRAMLLSASQAGLAAALVGCQGGVAAEEAERSGLWGSVRPGGEGAMLPTAALPSGTLEVFLIGGLNMWDTFYVLPEVGQPDRRMFYSFLDGPNGLEAFWRERCGGADRPLLVSPFATDGLGQQVHLGPLVDGLRQRPDLLARLRMWVIRHVQPAHETAVPYTLCGHAQSSPRMACTPSHVERFMQDRQDPARRTPWTAVLYPDLSDLVAYNGESASSIGLHRGSARPLSLRLSSSGIIRDGLGRERVSERADAFDRLVRGYGRAYEQRLVPPGGERVRAPAVDDWFGARLMLGRSADLISLMGEQAFLGRTGERCGDSTALDNTTMALDTAVHMLTDPTHGMRFITAIDGGLLPATAGGAYDTHIRHVQDSGRNIVHTIEQLCARINEPGEGDPAKLDLDHHMVLLTTEFGRTPVAVGDGLNHWADGYVVMAMGGPIDAERQGIVGAIGADGIATDWITPSDLRAALLLAQGIWPFSGQSFNVADISQGSTEIEAATWLKEHVLGYPS